MEPKTMAEMGLALLGEAVLSFMFNPTNQRTKRDRLMELGVPFEMGHEVLKHIEDLGKACRHSEASYWLLSAEEHRTRMERNGG